MKSTDGEGDGDFRRRWGSVLCGMASFVGEGWMEKKRKEKKKKKINGKCDGKEKKKEKKKRKAGKKKKGIIIARATKQPSKPRKQSKAKQSKSKNRHMSA